MSISYSLICKAGSLLLGYSDDLYSVCCASHRAYHVLMSSVYACCHCALSFSRRAISQHFSPLLVAFNNRLLSVRHFRDEAKIDMHLQSGDTYHRVTIAKLVIARLVESNSYKLPARLFASVHSVAEFSAWESESEQKHCKCSENTLE